MGEVVIGDDQCETELAGCLCFGDAADAAVDGDDQVATPGGDCSQRFVVEPVAFVDAAGNVRVGFRAELFEAEQEDRAGGDAVGVVVAVDGDAPAGANGPVDQLGGADCAW